MVQDGTPFTVNSHEGPIPALDDRVPVETDRLVWDVVDEIGEYGGTWRMAHENNFLLGRRVLSRGEAVHFAGDYLTKVPIFLKDFSSSADGRVHTFTLREGAKFSNGEPLDMEAVKFAHEAINDNIELHPMVPAGWRDPVTGNGVQFAVVDDLTFTYTFDNPNFGAIEGGTPGGVSYCAGWCMFAPVEWTSKLVPGYADAAALQASIDDADVEDWLANLRTRLSVHSTQAADMPAVGPYLHSEGKTVGDKIGFVSNPYHVIFDPEGNQVPYVDGIVSLGFESRDIAVFRAMNGESDGTAVPYAVGELPLYQSNMEKGDYSLYQWTDFGGGDVGFMFNQTFNEDPEIGRLLRTKEFRIAFSHAIDREEINDNVLLGLGSPQNAIPHPSHPYYPGPEWATLDIEHDPALAMQMLDAIGLVDTDGDGIRNRNRRPDRRQWQLRALHGGPAGRPHFRPVSRDYPAHRGGSGGSGPHAHVETGSERRHEDTRQRALHSNGEHRVRLGRELGRGEPLAERRVRRVRTRYPAKPYRAADREVGQFRGRRGHGPHWAGPRIPAPGA